jgi:HEPN domain-containing protein
MNLREAKKSAAHWPIPIEMICNFCHQSAEKYLKAYLYSKGIDDPPYIHSLPTLRGLCEQRDSDFSKIAKACNALNPYSVHPKYPDEVNITERQMQKAIKCTEEIKSFAPLVAVRESIGYRESQDMPDEKTRLNSLRTLIKEFGITENDLKTALDECAVSVSDKAKPNLTDKLAAAKTLADRNAADKQQEQKPPSRGDPR